MTAKLLAASFTSAILAIGYLGASLVGMMISSGEFSGLGAPARCLDIYAHAPLNLTVGALVILSILWLILTTVVFGLALAIFNTIFGGVKTYNILETPVSYGMMALTVCLVLGALACLLTYVAQKI